jgi:hypothetical protein
MELKRYKDFLNEGFMDPKPGPNPEKHMPFIYNSDLKPSDEGWKHVDSNVLIAINKLRNHTDIQRFQIVPYHNMHGYSVHEYNKEIVDIIKQKYKTRRKGYSRVSEEGYEYKSEMVSPLGDTVGIFLKDSKALFAVVNIKRTAGSDVYFVRPVDGKLYPDIRGEAGAIKYGILESKKNYSAEDKEELRKINSMRSRLRGYHPGDDCPLGSPFGGYTVRDTRSALTQKKKRIENKYKTEADWNKESDKRISEMEARAAVRKMYDSYNDAVYESLSKEDKLITDLYEDYKHIKFMKSRRRDPFGRAYKIYTSKEQAEFNEKLEKAGLKVSYLSDKVKDKKYELGVVTKADFEKVMNYLTKEDKKMAKPYHQFYAFIYKSPKLQKYVEPYKGIIGAFKFNII